MTHCHRAPVRRPGPRMWRLGLSGCLLAATALACGGRSADIPAPQLEADRVLYERGTTALEEGDWRRARVYFVQIRDNYPQSPHRPDSRLAIADTYEGEGTLDAYVRALDEFQDFLTLYPEHPRAPYAQYKIGMVHFHQMRRAERDQTETISAIQEFETFIRRFPPDHALMPEVRQRLRDAHDRLSGHDFVVGRFYYRFKNYAGAVSRFRQILDSDPGYTRRDEVYFYMAESLAARGNVADGISYFARILDEFETSEYAELATTRIEELEAVQEP